MIVYPEGAIKSLAELESITKTGHPVYQVLHGKMSDASNIENLIPVFIIKYEGDYATVRQMGDLYRITFSWRSLGFHTDEASGYFLPIIGTPTPMICSARQRSLDSLLAALVDTTCERAFMKPLTIPKPEGALSSLEKINRGDTLYVTVPSRCTGWGKATMLHDEVRFVVLDSFSTTVGGLRLQFTDDYSITVDPNLLYYVSDGYEPNIFGFVFRNCLLAWAHALRNENKVTPLPLKKP